MQNRKSPVRRHSRFPVTWSALYGNNSFLAEGTVLDLTALGWRMAGSMPVIPGMQLTVQVAVPERSTPLRVQRATVLWVKDHEFAIEAHELTPSDHAWVTEFLHHKLGLRWIPRTTNQETSLQDREDVLREAIHLPLPSIASIEDVLQRFLACHRDSANGPAMARWDGNLDSQEGEVDARLYRVPQQMRNEARGTLRKMVAINEACARTGRDPIANN